MTSFIAADGTDKCLFNVDTPLSEWGTVLTGALTRIGERQVSNVWTHFRSSFFGVLVVLLYALPTVAATDVDLHLVYIGGTLYEIDQADASVITTRGFQIGSYQRHWRDIATTAFDPTAVYGVSLENVSSARNLTRLDTTNGSTVDIPLAGGGSPNPASFGWRGLAFDPREPHIGYIGLTIASSIGGPQTHGIARFNLQTQQFEHSVYTTHRWGSLLMTEDGDLIGSVDFGDASRVRGDDTQVYDIDAITGETSLRFTLPYEMVPGLALHPTDGRLFAIGAFPDLNPEDEVIVIDRQSGALITSIGVSPTIGSNGLAFTSVAVAPTPGDANDDGRVDGVDYTVWATNYGDDPADAPPGSPGNGDFNDDGVVDGVDYVTWAIHFGQGPNDATAVPEPATFGLLALGALLLMFGRRRSS